MAGRWRIVEMDLGDTDVIDLVPPGFIEATADGGGSFRSRGGGLHRRWT
jgi:hypothetical protein